MENKQTHAAEQLVTDMHSTEIKELKQPKKGFNYWYIGQRIRDTSDLQFKATIRYIGPVATSEKKDTTWIGVEWDDSSRGKHNGSVTLEDGTLIQYFETNGGINSASFLKPSKVDPGIAVSEALKTRYVTLDAPQIAPGNVFAEHHANTVRGRAKPIEFFGEMKIRMHQQISDLKQVALRDMGISFAGWDEDNEDTEVEELGQYESLDLQRNLLSNWEEVGRITKRFHALQVLDLSANKLGQVLPSAFPILRDGFPSVHTLVLGFCELSWNDILVLEPCLPNLEELCFPGNDASALKQQAELTGFRKLVALDLSECKISSWEEVQVLSSLQLRSLSLNHNSITEIPPLQTDHDFCKLEVLGMSGNPIDSWHSVDQLAFLQQLHTLRLTSTPITNKLGPSEARLTLIGRLPKIQHLNGSAVSPRERSEAEKTYLRRILLQQKASPQNEGDSTTGTIAQLHPRFDELKKMYADTQVTFGGHTSSGGSLQDSLLTLTLHPIAASATSYDPVVKKLPSTLTILKLKQMCKRLFGVEPLQQSAFFRSDRTSPPTPLDDDYQTLNFFGVFDGCDVFINDSEQSKLPNDQQRMQENEKVFNEQLGHVSFLENVRRQQISLESQGAQMAAISSQGNVEKLL